tara:strand:- start:7679 stop:7843 length:165 start_codon:yes stop_codon:yes gene_type:complete
LIITSKTIKNKKMGMNEIMSEGVEKGGKKKKYEKSDSDEEEKKEKIIVICCTIM